MARKTATYIVLNENRDKGKVFLLTEMPASQAQRWALRAFLSLARNGVELPVGIEEMGIAGMVGYGIEMVSRLPFEEADLLCDSLMECVQAQPDANNPAIVRKLIEQDIEEVSTRLILLKEVFKLHVDFSALAKNSTPGSGDKASTATSS